MMRSDLNIRIAVISMIIIYLLVLIIPLITNKFRYLPGFINLLTASSILIYRVQKQLRIHQHIFEWREMLALCFEIAVIGLAIYSLINGQGKGWLKATQYIFLSIHLLALVAFLIFMLTFKMKRLI